MSPFRLELYCIYVLIVTCRSLLQCSNGSCVFNNLPHGETIICTKNATTCEVHCDNQNGCKGSTIYLSASTNNTVYCESDQSCNNTTIYCGIPPNAPNNYSLTDFNAHINECKFYFNSNSASYTTNVYCSHDIDLCYLESMNDTYNDNFKGIFECELSPLHSKCVLNCQSSCIYNASEFICNASECICNEQCGNTSNYLIYNTTVEVNEVMHTSDTTLNIFNQKEDKIVISVNDVTIYALWSVVVLFITYLLCCGFIVISIFCCNRRSNQLNQKIDDILSSKHSYKHQHIYNKSESYVDHDVKKKTKSQDPVTKLDIFDAFCSSEEQDPLSNNTIDSNILGITSITSPTSSTNNTTKEKQINIDDYTKDDYHITPKDVRITSTSIFSTHPQITHDNSIGAEEQSLDIAPTQMEPSASTINIKDDIDNISNQIYSNEGTPSVSKSQSDCNHAKCNDGSSDGNQPMSTRSTKFQLPKKMTNDGYL